MEGKNECAVVTIVQGTSPGGHMMMLGYWRINRIYSGKTLKIRRTKMKRLIISMIVTLIMVLGLLPTAVMADTSGNSTGSFSVGISAPTVNSVRLYESDGTTLATSMTPQTPYVFKIDVTDFNGFGHMKTVRLVVFYSATTPQWASAAVLLSSPTNIATAPKDVVVTSATGFAIGDKVLIKDTVYNEYNTIASIVGTTLTMTTNLAHDYSIANFFRATVTNFHNLPTTPNSQTVAQFNWNVTGPTTSSWTASYPAPAGDTAGSTWSSRNFTTPDLTNLTLNNFVLQGEFTPGKVATAGHWYLRVRATDDQNYDGRGNTSEITMNPYDEIVLGTTSLSWGQVSPGLAFTGFPNPKDITVKYIANGGYNKYISSSNWSGVNYTAVLDNDGAASIIDHFALQAELDSTHLVTSATPYGALMDNIDGLTLEEGDNYSPTSVEHATMALKLAPTFDSDAYQGYIYYYIIAR
jgi:hypothetical protein